MQGGMWGSWNVGARSPSLFTPATHKGCALLPPLLFPGTLGCNCPLKSQCGLCTLLCQPRWPLGAEAMMWEGQCPGGKEFQPGHLDLGLLQGPFKPQHPGRPQSVPRALPPHQSCQEFRNHESYRPGLSWVLQALAVALSLGAWRKRQLH